ncbi:MAG: glycosyltransferase family 2 protein, partial [Pseudonocardiaceae bacterium]
IERVLAADYPVDDVELVLVENGSTDGTRAVLAAGDWPDSVRIVEVDHNRGKGEGIRTALEHARGHWSAIIDADLEYDPGENKLLLNPLLEGKADAAIGTRLFQSHSAYGFRYVAGNRVINLAANMLYNSWLSDICNCFKDAETEVLRSLGLTEDGFGIDAEIPARLLRAGHKIYEVPVTYSARSREEGKKLTAADGARLMATLLRCRLR